MKNRLPSSVFRLPASGFRPLVSVLCLLSSVLWFPAHAGRVAFPGYDWQVMDWNNRSSTNSGGNDPRIRILPSTRLAATEFMRAVRNASLYPGKILRLNFFAGSGFLSDSATNLGAISTPIIIDAGSHDDGTAQAAATFSYTEQGSAGGLSGNAAAALQTGFIASTSIASATNVHFAIYVTVPGSAAATWSMGAQDATPNDYGLIGPDFTAVGTRGDTWQPGTAFSDSGGKGFYHVQKEGVNNVTYKNGVSKASNAPGGIQTTVEMYVLALNLNGARSSSSGKTFGGYSIGLSIPTAQVVPYYNAWQRFETMLGRQQ